MKKNENKQKKSSATALKIVLKSDGRKLTWLASVTNIQYQRLQRIVNQGYDPSIREAVKIAGALKRPIGALFPLEGMEEAFVQNAPAITFNSSPPVKEGTEN